MDADIERIHTDLMALEEGNKERHRLFIDLMASIESLCDLTLQAGSEIRFPMRVGYLMNASHLIRQIEDYLRSEQLLAIKLVEVYDKMFTFAIDHSDDEATNALR